MQKDLENLRNAVARELLRAVTLYLKASQEVLNEPFTDGMTYQEYFAHEASDEMLHYLQELNLIAQRDPIQQEAFADHNLQAFLTSATAPSFWFGPYYYPSSEREIRWHKTYDYVVESIVTEMETINLYESYIQETKDKDLKIALTEIVNHEKGDLADFNQMLFSLLSNPPVVQTQQSNGQMQFTLAQLTQYNGTNGMPAYIAVSGKVYDVTRVPAWQGGSHYGLMAGRDVTAQFMNCHPAQGMILNGLPLVGVLV
ncbi:cytochrome b5 domain-containing protein [Desulforamulus aeronauticus]|uniref:Predicted heme/steroid binding protein n=1 Tax=Desulforamulus aeronauticus DSM 10349 TaxID=1121421 RepID=A0A1M6XII3_9FIRM|nr:cytochrome b5 domain-containing protein [Desulforamulus aeronauticus]SHL05751.1 Predicted heme/steroid binding protein [Desulforamulus aeronauticus DSM 10349]